MEMLSANYIVEQMQPQVNLQKKVKLHLKGL